MEEMKTGLPYRSALICGTNINIITMRQYIKPCESVVTTTFVFDENSFLVLK